MKLYLVRHAEAIERSSTTPDASRYLTTKGRLSFRKIARRVRKAGIARMMWLRPSYSSLADMKALARRIKRDGAPILNMLFHSSEAITGGSPYNRTAQELAEFFVRLGGFFEFAIGELGAVPVTFGEFHARFCAGGKM